MIPITLSALASIFDLVKFIIQGFFPLQKANFFLPHFGKCFPEKTRGLLP